MLNSRWKTLHTDVSSALWPCCSSTFPPNSLFCVCVGRVGEKGLESLEAIFPQNDYLLTFTVAFKSTFLVEFESMPGRVFLNPGF